MKITLLVYKSYSLFLSREMENNSHSASGDRAQTISEASFQCQQKDIPCCRHLSPRLKALTVQNERASHLSFSNT